MAAESAGILMYRRRGGLIEVLLAHPGGPFWARRDAGAWSLPKGEIEAGEQPDYTARREFAEELGVVPTGRLDPLGTVRQAGGKLVHGFAMAGDFDPADFASNLFEMEWPPRSGRMRSFPEIDRIGWFDLETAAAKINPGQRPLIDRLSERLEAEARGQAPPLPGSDRP